MANRKLMLALLFMVLSFAEAEAQEIEFYKRSHYAYWGFGWGGQKVARNFGFVSQIDQKSVIAITTQRTWQAPLVHGPMIMSSGSNIKQTTSGAFSILYGRIIKKNWGHYIFMAGPSFVGATKYNDLVWGTYYPESLSSIGLLLQTSVLPSSEFIGAGANLFVNINRAFSYSGITLNFALGKVNYKQVGGHAN